MATLYEINNAINDVLEQGFSFDEETGEILYEEPDLAQLQIDLETKLDNIACFIKNEEAEAEMIRVEELKLAKRRKTKEKKAEYLKGYLSAYMDSTNREKFESARSRISFRKSESLQVEDVYKVPEDYLRYKEPEVNKAELKKAIKSGLVVDGVSIISGRNIQVK